MTTEQIIDSTPDLCGFNPHVIPYQAEVLKLVRKDWDYREGYLSILLSGSFGSAKSTLIAHIVVTHCLLYPGARACLARKGMPDLKRTILREVLEHINKDLIEGKDFRYNKADPSITFANGSEIICMSWSDKQYMKGRSLSLSLLAIEEIVENNAEDKQAFDTLTARVGRQKGIPEKLVIAASNPDTPAHWVFGHWIDDLARKNHPNRFVFYSLTEQNPFLPPDYIETLRRDMSEREADRYLRGKWIDLRQAFIYYEYDHDLDFYDYDYQVDINYPIHMTWDFNIADGKPLSAAFFQYIDGVMHIFDEVVVEGFRTRDALDEAAGRMLFEHKTHYEINGDSAGRARDTRSKVSDFDIINKYLSNFETMDGRKLRFSVFVPASNPPVRSRHNWLNALIRNDKGERRLRIYKNAKTADMAMRLTKLKKGSGYIEDDSDYFQHIGTAIGYGLHAIRLRTNRKSQGTTQL